MATVIRAHFDGKVIVPDEPVDLPLNEPIKLQFVQGPEPIAWDPEKAKQAIKWLTERAIPGLNIPDEALRRENMYEDRGL
jgi:hypothetical protein